MGKNVQKQWVWVRNNTKIRARTASSLSLCLPSLARKLGQDLLPLFLSVSLPSLAQENLGKKCFLSFSLCLSLLSLKRIRARTASSLPSLPLSLCVSPFCRSLSPYLPFSRSLSPSLLSLSLSLSLVAITV